MEVSSSKPRSVWHHNVGSVYRKLYADFEAEAYSQYLRQDSPEARETWLEFQYCEHTTKVEKKWPGKSKQKDESYFLGTNGRPHHLHFIINPINSLQQKLTKKLLDTEMILAHTL